MSEEQALKTSYRLLLRQKRKNLSPHRKQAAALAALLELSKIAKPGNLILSYASFKTELDTHPFNQWLIREGGLVLPRIEGLSLRLFHVKNEKFLEANRWGIAEPIPSLCEEVEPTQLSMAFIPGLGFDLLTGHRLGYGGGYYDRLLSLISKQVPCYGIGFKEQACPFLPFAKWDMALKTHYLF